MLRIGSAIPARKVWADFWTKKALSETKNREACPIVRTKLSFLGQILFGQMSSKTRNSGQAFVGVIRGPGKDHRMYWLALYWIS